MIHSVKKCTIVLFVFISLLFISFSAPASYAYTTNMDASIVIGQQDFTHNAANQGGSVSANGYSNPQWIATDGKKLIVPDAANNRVLIYNSIPTSNNVAADVVIGQPNFTSNLANQGGSVGANTLSDPRGVATDGIRLFISEVGNNRVLIYNHIPTTNNASADVVIGQQDFTHNAANQGGASPTEYTMYNPMGLFYDKDSKKLFVTDVTNGRVLIYDSIPTTNGIAANVEVGQKDFYTRDCTNVQLSPCINNARAIVANGKLIFPGNFNNRVFIYNSIPTTNGVYPDVVIGQPNFTSISANQGGSPAANTLNGPFDSAYDGRHLFISDNGNNRILVYDGIPTSNNASAKLVIGQPNLTSNSINQGLSVNANTLNVPRGIVLFNNKLIVSDRGNARVLIFNNITASLMNGISVLPGNTGATISYSTSSPTSEYIDYGTSPSYGTTTGLLNNGSNRKTDHTVTLSGLQPCTTYHFQVTATDSNLQDQVSGDQTFTTTGTCTGFTGSWKDSNNNDVTFDSLGGDNVYTNDTLPTFSFTQAADSNNGISKYQIIVTSADKGDQVYLDDIQPTSNTSTDIFEDDTRWEQYNTDRHTITVRSKDESHRLTPGAYRWKVRAINSKGANLESSSKILRVQTNQAVFSSNSLAFPLALMQVGNKLNMNISTYNLLSIPTKPLAITTTTPTFYGITNVGVHVKLTLVKHHDTENYDDTYSYTTDANAESRYGINVTPALSAGTYQVTLSATNDSGDYVMIPSFPVTIGVYSSYSTTSTASKPVVQGVSTENTKTEETSLSPTSEPTMPPAKEVVETPSPSPSKSKSCFLWVFCK